MGRRSLAAVLLLCTPLLAAAETIRFYGFAYDQDTAEFLYTEVHEQQVEDQRWLGGTVRYYLPDGSLHATKTLDFSASRLIPETLLEVPSSDYVEGIIDVEDSLVRLERVLDGKRRRAEFRRRDDMAGDAGLGVLLYEHFDALAAGETVTFRLVLPGALTTQEFEAVPQGTVELDAGRALRVSLQPTNMAIRVFVPPLDMYFSVDDQRLLEYHGVATLRDRETDKLLQARIVYRETAVDHPTATIPPLDPANAPT